MPEPREIAAALTEPQRAHYYVSGVVITMERGKAFQIMEETPGKQVCIAVVPFNGNINPNLGYTPARKDALMIANALNNNRQFLRENDHAG